MKTIVIMGTMIKNKRFGDYAVVRTKDGRDLVYNVDDSVTVDDIHYYLKTAGLRIIPKDLETGQEFSFAVGVDSERKSEGKEHTHGKILNRVGFTAQLKRDMKNLEWNRDARRDKKS